MKFIYLYEADSFSYVISGDENVISDLHLVYLRCGLNFSWNGAHYSTCVICSQVNGYSHKRIIIPSESMVILIVLYSS